jgi:two-component system NtrC family sensor kinase
MAMVLLDGVMFITARRDLVQAHAARGDLFLSFLQEAFATGENGRRMFEASVKISRNAGVSCFVVVGPDNQQIFYSGQSCAYPGELIHFGREALETGVKSRHFLGSTWGFWGKQKTDLALSGPIYRNGERYAGASLLLPLEAVYQTVRRTQKILIIYIGINALILSAIGMYQISKIYFRPLARLAKRAEDYNEDDEVMFSVRKEDNELHKLSKALNSMLRRIAADKETLKATVSSVEKANAELKQAQRDIIRAEKLASVGRLSAGIAHEIGNPIGIVNGYLELLKQADVTRAEQIEYITRTENEINRINTIIRQLLDLARPSRSGAEIVSVHEIVRDITDVFKFQPLMSDINWEVMLEAERDTIFADPGQLRQVFLNLILNAGDAIALSDNRHCGKLRIQSRLISGRHGNGEADASALQMIFQDNGTGIPEEHLSNVFDPFFTTKDPGKGTGLGLSVSFMIVEGMGGTIQASSNEGQGTTMTLLLPLCDSNSVGQLG